MEHPLPQCLYWHIKVHYILLRKAFTYQVCAPSTQITTHFSFNEPDFLGNIQHKSESECIITEGKNPSSILAYLHDCMQNSRAFWALFPRL